MNFNFKETYDNLISSAKDRYIDSSNFKSEPVMESGIITPGSSICIQPAFGIEFKLDKEGMHKLLEALEKQIKVDDESNKNLLVILTKIHNVVDEFLGGRADSVKRKIMYMRNGGELSLSDIQGQFLGQCAERAAIAHQCLLVIKEHGLLPNHSPEYTATKISIDGKSAPHAVVVLRSTNPDKSNYLFDIENPVNFVQPNGTKNKGVGLYVVSPEQLSKFEKGDFMPLTPVYVQLGCKMDEKERCYGNDWKDISTDVPGEGESR